MPSVYEAQCPRCGCKGRHSTARYGAVFMDEPVEEESLTTKAHAVQSRSNLTALVADPEDCRMLVLAHPLEGRILKEAGYTWDTVKKAGRFVLVDEVVCECGKTFRVRKLMGPAFSGGVGSCLVFAGMLMATIDAGLQMESFWFAIGALLVITWSYVVAEQAYGRWYIRCYFRERAKAIDGPSQCPDCGSKDFVSIARSRTFPCPQCGETAMRFITVART
jgi:ssDNA-binding Zn-finger/Zn-ribbon topoisomerase 1